MRALPEIGFWFLVIGSQNQKLSLLFFRESQFLDI